MNIKKIICTILLSFTINNIIFTLTSNVNNESENNISVYSNNEIDNTHSSN